MFAGVWFVLMFGLGERGLKGAGGGELNRDATGERDGEKVDLFPCGLIRINERKGKRGGEIIRPGGADGAGVIAASGIDNDERTDGEDLGFHVRGKLKREKSHGQKPSEKGKGGCG
jgi:hypothetical protein